VSVAPWLLGLLKVGAFLICLRLVFVWIGKILDTFRNLR
jgi:hypothetical protein